jgi:hypothetical protein
MRLEPFGELFLQLLAGVGQGPLLGGLDLAGDDPDVAGLGRQQGFWIRSRRGRWMGRAGMLDEAGEARSCWWNRMLRRGRSLGQGGSRRSRGSGRLGYGFGHAGSRHDRHGDAIDGLADLLGGLLERLTHVVRGFIERLTNLNLGLCHDPVDVSLGFDGNAMGIAPGFGVRAFCLTVSLGRGPFDFTGGPEVTRAVHVSATG